VRFYFPNKPVRVYNADRLVRRLSRQEGWIGQPKWDGKRAEIACEDGKVVLHSREGREWPQERWDWLADLPLPQPWFLDGELTRDNHIRVWDFAVLGGEVLYRTPYGDRLSRLEALLPSPLEQGGQSFACIETRPLEACGELLAREGDEFLEGVVWKRLDATDLWGPNSTSQVGSQFKFRF
jgi:ATP-dependent DNA ligase